MPVRSACFLLYSKPQHCFRLPIAWALEVVSLQRATLGNNFNWHQQQEMRFFVRDAVPLTNGQQLVLKPSIS